MKNYLLLFALLMVGMLGNAQIKTPAPSPSMKFTQTVGLTDVDVAYSRPSMKGRTIFSADGLVPYGKFWRTGANTATKITFSNDVMINGSKLEKGSYAILSQPGAAQWTVNFYPYESGSWTSYTEKTPALSTMAKPTKSGNSVESLLIYFDDLRNNGASLNIAWVNTNVALNIETTDVEKIENSIQKTLSGPSNDDYYTAASYYAGEGKNLEQALEWITKATSGDSPKFWQVRKKSEILSKLGRASEAIAAMKSAISLAKAAGYDGYVGELEGALKKLMK